MKIPDFNTKKELFEFLKKNRTAIISARKEQIKLADGVLFTPPNISEPSSHIIKQIGTIKQTEGADDLVITAVINTTNIMDSHSDVHIPGLWDKSLKENKMLMHLQEHKMEFEKIISDGKELKAYTEEFKWKELGWKYQGTTEALIFISTIKADRNPYMADQYAKKRVKNHSVGMRYVKLYLAIDDEDYESEFKVWEKYIDQVGNRKAAEDQGYFWAVTEAKIIEGSAVPIGSNPATPTIDTKEPPEEGTPQEPSEKDTQIKQFYSQLKY